MRASSALLAVAATAALLLSAPAHAASSVTFKDEVGDATALAVDHPLPTPNEDGLDIVEARLSSDGKTFFYAVKLKSVQPSGGPAGATGHYFRLYFTYGEVDFHFRVLDDAAAGQQTTIVATADTTQARLNCSSCLGLLDRKTSTMTLKAPVASLSSAVRQADGTLKAVGPGAKFTDLRVETQRSISIPMVVSITPKADDAMAPANTEFVF